MGLVMLWPGILILKPAEETRLARQHGHCFVTLAECIQQLIEILDGPCGACFSQPRLRLQEALIFNTSISKLRLP